MAYLLSVSFSMPLQGSYDRRLTGVRLSNPLPCRTVKKHLSPKYSGGAMISLKGSHHFDICPPARQFHQPVLRDNVCCSGHVLISGFWRGPDVEDGWGFIEATVHRIY